MKQIWASFQDHLRGWKTWVKIAILVFIAFGVLIFLWIFNWKTSFDSTSQMEEVATSVIYERDFFSDYRRKRESWRSDEEDLYRSIIHDDYLDVADKSAASADYDLYLQRCELEDKVEEILKGRGYADAIFSIEDQLSFLILKKDFLSEEEKSDLSDFLAAYAGIDSERLTIFTAE